MGRPRKIVTMNEDVQPDQDQEIKTITSGDIEWTDHVLSLLNDDEKIAGNPTTDGLRRIFEKALDCILIKAESVVTQSPNIENERRATVVHTLTYIINNQSESGITLSKTVSGAADVYWGNCDKVYRNHPVAVAETRAEGRALRRALKLRKVVAAEELAKDIDTNHLEENNISKVNSTQINFFEVFGKRLNINVIKLLQKLAIDTKNIYNISYDDAVKTITTLSSYQQNNDIPQDIIGYEPNWK